MWNRARYKTTTKPNTVECNFAKHMEGNERWYWSGYRCYIAHIVTSQSYQCIKSVGSLITHHSKPHSMQRVNSEIYWPGMLCDRSHTRDQWSTSNNVPHDNKILKIFRNVDTILAYSHHFLQLSWKPWLLENVYATKICILFITTTILQDIFHSKTYLAEIHIGLHV